MRNVMLFLLISVFLISLTSASIPNLEPIKQDQCIELIQTCSDCTYNNISKVLYPNSTVILENVAMEKDDTYYNYTFCNTSTLGTYTVNGFGDLGGTKTTWNYNFEVTPIGLTQTTAQGIGSAIYLVLMLVLMFVFGFLGFKMLKTENWWILGIFLIFLSALFLVYNTWLGYEYHRLFTGLPDSGMPETIFWIFLLLIAAGVLASVILLFRHWRKVIRYLKKEMKRKEPKDTDLEDWDLEDWAGEEWGPPKGFK